jgi:hypothetical protein
MTGSVQKNLLPGQQSLYFIEASRPILQEFTELQQLLVNNVSFLVKTVSRHTGMGGTHGVYSI